MLLSLSMKCGNDNVERKKITLNQGLLIKNQELESIHDGIAGDMASLLETVGRIADHNPIFTRPKEIYNNIRKLLKF